MNKKYFISFFIILFILSVFLFLGCSEKKINKKKTVAKKSIKKTEEKKVSNQIKKEKIKAEKEKIKKEQNFDKAYKSGWSFLKKAYLHGEPGADEIARMWFERAVQLCPKCPKPYFHISAIYSFQEKYEEAYKWKEKALNNLGANVLVKYKCCFYIFNKARGAKYSREIRWAKEDYIIWNELGEKKFFLREDYFRKELDYSVQKNFDKAIDACEKAIEIYPESTQGYFRLSNIYTLKLNFEKRGIEILLRALKINPYAAEIYIELGNVYERIGEYNKAIKAFQKALELDLNEKEKEKVKREIENVKIFKRAEEIRTKLAPFIKEHLERLEREGRK